MIPQAIELVEMIPVDLFLDWKIMKAENTSNIFSFIILSTVRQQICWTIIWMTFNQYLFLRPFFVPLDQRQGQKVQI